MGDDYLEKASGIRPYYLGEGSGDTVYDRGESYFDAKTDVLATFSIPALIVGAILFNEYYEEITYGFKLTAAAATIAAATGVSSILTERFAAPALKKKIFWGIGAAAVASCMGAYTCIESPAEKARAIQIRKQKEEKEAAAIRAVDERLYSSYIARIRPGLEKRYALAAKELFEVPLQNSGLCRRDCPKEEGTLSSPTYSSVTGYNTYTIAAPAAGVSKAKLYFSATYSFTKDGDTFKAYEDTHIYGGIVRRSQGWNKPTVPDPGLYRFLINGLLPANGYTMSDTVNCDLNLPRRNAYGSESVTCVMGSDTLHFSIRARRPVTLTP